MLPPPFARNGTRTRAGKIALLKAVLPVIANYPQLWVDNDDGDIMWGPAVVSRLAAEPAWTLGVPTTTGD